MKQRPVVAGMGPAGLFAALLLAQAGQQPIVLERGAPVEERSRDVEHFWQSGELRPESNVQFGEGGAGTFSDGKLNTGTKDFRARKVLEEFVRAGAPEDILVNAKPPYWHGFASRRHPGHSGRNFVLRGARCGSTPP